VENDDLSSLAGAGNLYSSAGDLIRWTEALHGGKVLSPASLAEMLTPFLDGYGYVLQIDSSQGSLDISHNGAVDGFFSFLDYIPRTRTTVVVLSNLVAEGNHSTPGSVPLDTELVRLAISDDAVLPSEGKEATVSAETLRTYTGRYRSTDPDRPQVILFSLADGHLYIQNEGAKDTVRMFAETSSRFYLANQEIEFIFDPHNAGSLQVVDLSGINATSFTRIEDRGSQSSDQGHGKGKT
jgi:hypothetical protein